VPLVGVATVSGNSPFFFGGTRLRFRMYRIEGRGRSAPPPFSRSTNGGHPRRQTSRAHGVACFSPNRKKLPPRKRLAIAGVIRLDYLRTLLRLPRVALTLTTDLPGPSAVGLPEDGGFRSRSRPPANAAPLLFGPILI